MKTFRYLGSTGTKTTMTVKELQDKLAEYPDDMPVLATWEGVYAPITADSFTTAPYTRCLAEDACPVLEIDVDNY